MIDGQKELLLETKKYNFKKVLDIGLGRGEASSFFIKNGKEVYATGFFIDTYKVPKNLLPNLKLFKNIDTTNLHCFKNNQFDAVWCAHVLEHIQNIGLALKEIHRILKDNGILFIMIPPYKSKVVGGHLNPGSNLGNLMYNLLLTGFNIKEGSFIKHKYNICGFVRKGKFKLPKLRHDAGDIGLLKDCFPMKVYQGFEGNIEKINWKWGYYKPRLLDILKKKIRYK